MNIKKKEYSKKLVFVLNKKTSTLKKAKGLSGSSAFILELFLSKPNRHPSFKGTAMFWGIAYYKGLTFIKPDHSNTLLLPQGYETIIVWQRHQELNTEVDRKEHLKTSIVDFHCLTN